MTVAEEWAEQAHYDFETAKAMLAAGRYLYVLFCFQQGVEKALKGLIAHRTNRNPPRLHNLMRLAEHAGLEIEDDTAAHLRTLTNAYVQSRYPGGLAQDRGARDRPGAEDALRATEEFLNWLFGLMKA